MSAATQPTLELLLTEADWLRRLAHHLVRDPATADDVVQETWVKALGSGARPPLGESQQERRGWLAAVARRVAGHHYRGESRRKGREERAATHTNSQEVPSAAAVSARMELQSQVAQALVDIPDPYRTTLYLLYYEGRSASEVAQSLGEPEGTVRSRAHRGRQLLRKTLVKEGEDWNQWALALTPWLGTPGRAAAVAPLAWTAGAGAGLRWLLLGGSALLACAGTWWLSQPAVDEPPMTPLVAKGMVAPDLATAVAAQAQGEEAPVAERRDAPLQESGAPVPVLVTGTVTDTEGNPARGVYLTFESGDDKRQVRSDAEDGSFAVPALPSGTWSLRPYLVSYRRQYLTVEIPAKAQHELNVVMEPVLRIPVRFRNPDGTPLRGATQGETRTYQSLAKPIPLEDRQGPPTEIRTPMDRVRSHSLVKPPTLYPSVIVTRERPGNHLAEPVEGRVKRYGIGTWEEQVQRYDNAPKGLPEDCQGMLTFDSDPPAWVSLVYGDMVIESRHLSAAPEELEFTVDQGILRAEHGTLRFALIDPESGANMSAAYLESHGSVSVDNQPPTWTGCEDGQVTVYEVPPGLHRVRLGHLKGAREQSTFTCYVLPGETIRLDPIPLLPAKPFEVRVLDSRGAPVAASVRAHRKDHPGVHEPEHWSGSWQTDGSGVASLESVGAGELLIQVSVHGQRLYFGRTLDTRESTRLEVVVPEVTQVSFQRIPQLQRTRLDLLDAQGIPLNVLGSLSGTFYLPPGSYSIRRRDTPSAAPVREFSVGDQRLFLDLTDLN